MRRGLFPLAGALLAAACISSIAGPDESLDGLPPGLVVALTVEPGTVGQHAPFEVRLDVTNTTLQVIEVVTSHSCLAIPDVLRNGERLPFEGSAWGCRAAITTHVFPPGETHTIVWQMRAELYAAHPGDVAGAPAPRGEYVVRAEFDVLPVHGAAARPTITRLFRVE